jgi:hypothetical protein
MGRYDLEIRSKRKRSLRPVPVHNGNALSRHVDYDYPNTFYIQSGAGAYANTSRQSKYQRDQHKPTIFFIVPPIQLVYGVKT